MNLEKGTRWNGADQDDFLIESYLSVALLLKILFTHAQRINSNALIYLKFQRKAKRRKRSMRNHLPEVFKKNYLSEESFSHELKRMGHGRPPTLTPQPSLFHPEHWIHTKSHSQIPGGVLSLVCDSFTLNRIISTTHSIVEATWRELWSRSKSGS